MDGCPPNIVFICVQQARCSAVCGRAYSRLCHTEQVPAKVEESHRPLNKSPKLGIFLKKCTKCKVDEPSKGGALMSNKKLLIIKTSVSHREQIAGW